MALVGLSAALKVPLDPYLVWAVGTEFRDYALDEKARVAFAVECKTTVAAFAVSIRPGIDLSGLYTDSSADANEARFCTVAIGANDLGDLWTNLLHLLPLANRIELGTAIRAVDFTMPPLSVVPWTSSGVVVGVIDDFVAFGNPCFESSDFDTSRVRYVWSQAAAAPRAGDAQWGEARVAGYGHELSSLPRSPSAGPPTLQELREAYPVVLPRFTHGTHVADIAAGNLRKAGAKKLCAHDIIAVHLPRRVLADSSGGALSVQALDGLRYILCRAGPAAPVVVNLSYGTTAGPHDGTSILEQAIDQLIELRPGRLSVVVPAGNAYEDRGHASVLLGPQRPKATLNWKVLPDDATPSFMEIWLPEHASEHFSVDVRGPSGVHVHAGAAPAIEFDDMTNRPRATVGVVHLSKVANGNLGTMVLVALAATQGRQAGAPVAAHGLWEIELSYAGANELPGPVRIWIERDDTVHGQPRAGRQSHLIDAEYQMPYQTPETARDDPDSQVQRHGAFNTIATGTNTIVVGGYVGKTGKHAVYSGAGPTRAARPGPNVLARSEETETQHGLRAAAVGGVDSVRLRGTSVGVPQIVRWIADWHVNPGGALPHKLFPEQICERLREQVPKNPFDQPLPEPDEHRDGVGRVLPPA